MRTTLTIACAGETLVATLDAAAGMTGLVIVSGGNEVRSGAHRGMAMLAARLAAAGVPVLRFDRRGVGDASGKNRGYAHAAEDIAAAAAALRAHQPHVTRLVGFGNCDAASALALYGQAAGIDAVVLANPWVVETDALPPAAAIRHHYARRLASPAAWRALLSGRTDLRSLMRGLRKIARSEPQDLADRITTAIAGWRDGARVVLARGDATAIAYTDAAARRRLTVATRTINTASHSFAGDDDALYAILLEAIRPLP